MNTGRMVCCPWKPANHPREGCEGSRPEDGCPKGRSPEQPDPTQEGHALIVIIHKEP
jgi:hypothetical protein